MSRYLQAGSPFLPEQLATITTDFHREGYAVIPDVLKPDVIAEIRRISDEFMNDPGPPKRHIPKGFILRNTLELHRVFVELLVREPILSLAKAIVGERCKFVGQDVIRNPPGRAIAHWHVDDVVEFPLPPEMQRHDPRVRMPVQSFTIQMALSDIDCEADGPTQVVPGSHYAERGPNDQTNPTFDGRGPVSIFCKAGDIYLQNNQCWHRGAPNTGKRTRHIIQSQYAQRWAWMRCGAFNRVPIPEDTLRAATPEVLDVMGLTSERTPVYYTKDAAAR
jgi:ectoine hydroxylase-related dioxygenase (phytanoyl-CoA dioxygenase family)